MLKETAFQSEFSHYSPQYVVFMTVPLRLWSNEYSSLSTFESVKLWKQLYLRRAVQNSKEKGQTGSILVFSMQKSKHAHKPVYAVNTNEQINCL